MAGMQQQFSIDYAIVRPDGSERIVALTGKTIMDHDGVLTGIRGTMQDITERNELQREIRHLASFPTLNSNPVLEIGTDGIVRYANAASEKALAHFGMAPDVRQFLPGRPEELSRLWVQCSLKPQLQELHLGEATFQISITAPIADTLRIYATDITERVHLAEGFSYSVSHDLRAPLRSIDGFSHAFLEDYGDMVPAEARGNLDRIRSAAQRMEKIIEALLQLSHLTRCRLQMQKTDFSALAAEVSQELTLEAPERDVQWNIEPGMTAIGDPQMLRVVLVNLLKNAWKFTSKREHAHIAVGTTQDPEHGETFFIHDDGAGFDAKYGAKLFIAFQRLHDQQEYPGTGIGLATVQRAVRRHGGDVWAMGEVDRGATFYFSIPVHPTSIPYSEEQS